MHSNSREEISVAMQVILLRFVGLKDTTTGDTLCDVKRSPIVLERMEFPEPVIEIAVEPKTKADQEKMSTSVSAFVCRRSIIPRAC